MIGSNYVIQEADRSKDGVKFIFTSEGNSDVIKAIQYKYLTSLNGKRVYNLGFGDYCNDTIIDDINSENGDVYWIFNTVLSTIPKFFEIFDSAIMVVSGSDSTESFVEKCKLICKKKCINICKNQHRRIRTYRYYVDKNFDLLSEDYSFAGGILGADNQTVLEMYVPFKEYDSIWVIKK